MSEADQSDEKLERLYARVLPGQPLRRAPPTLESRVFDELARRDALPWWRHSFAHWPNLARAAFVLICASLSGLAFLGGARLVAGLGSLAELRRPWAITSTAMQLCGSLLRTIPAPWLYEGLAAAAILYAMLFALGATAYRTLYL
jgi:hypothetical protein